MNVKPALYQIARIGSILCSVLTLFILTTTTAVAADVTLRWNANSPAPEGYRLFARRGDQVYNFSHPDWEGVAATCTIKLEDQTEYYFVVRAYTDYLESTNSNEVHYRPPASTNPIPPAPITGASPGSGIDFLQDSGANGLVEMDAFDFSAEASRSNHSWEAVKHLGVDAMEAIPDSGARIASGYVSSSPYLRFNVNFQKTGTHYVWLRGFCQGSDNTAHVGVNGNASASSANIKLLVNNGWVWSGTTMGGARATVSVSKTGLQTVDVYMREDGLILDKVLITSSSAYKPSGSGPAESVRQ